MTTDAREVVRQVFREHRWNGRSLAPTQCSCGDDISNLDDHRTSIILAALATAGKVIVDLPEPDSTAADGRYVAGWNPLGDHDSVRVDCFGNVEYVGVGDYTPNEARDLAAALLAAAKAAEAQQ